MLRRSKAKKMRSDARTTACEYRKKSRTKCIHMRDEQRARMRRGWNSCENAIGCENSDACECWERAMSEKMHPYKRRPACQNAKGVKSRENAIGCEDSGVRVQIERKVGENASLCEKSSAPVCEGGEKAVKMWTDVRTAARVNPESEQRQRKCILIKEDRRARMLRRSKAEKMPSYARTVACEYR